MEEIWKPIPGYEGYYEVSSLGRVRSLDRTTTYWRNGVVQSVTYRGKMLNLNIADDGYVHVMLPLLDTSPRKYRYRSVHQLVALTFLPNPDEKIQVNHIDGNKANNSVKNLEWVTQEENMEHAKRTKLWDPKKCGEASRRKLGISVRCKETGQIFMSIKQAAKWSNNDDSMIVESCETGRSRKGYTFEYVN